MLAQGDQMRRGQRYQVVAAQEVITQFHHLGTEAIAARLRILGQVAQRFPGVGKALRGAFAHAGELHDVGEAERVARGIESLQHAHAFFHGSDIQGVVGTLGKQSGGGSGHGRLQRRGYLFTRIVHRQAAAV